MSKTQFGSLLLIITLLLTVRTYAGEYRLPSGEVLQDPTRPQQVQGRVLQGKAKQDATFTLNYILSKGLERRAMINGQKVVVGDQVSGATVKRIEGDRVVLSYEGKLTELRLNKVKGITRN